MICAISVSPKVMAKSSLSLAPISSHKTGTFPDYFVRRDCEGNILFIDLFPDTCSQSLIVMYWHPDSVKILCFVLY